MYRFAPKPFAKMWSRFFFLFSMLILSVGEVATAQESSVDPVLSPGDAIRITVWRRPELTGEFPIASDGTISHPLLREVQVAGVQFSTVEERIRNFLQSLEANPQFVIQPLLRVSIGGEVRQPSLYRLPPATSIAEAVAVAGGLSDRGNLSKVRLIRKNQQTLVDLNRPELGLAQQSIRSGDQIFVERRSAIFRDYIAPASGLFAALISLVGIMTR